MNKKTSKWVTLLLLSIIALFVIFIGFSWGKRNAGQPGGSPVSGGPPSGGAGGPSSGGAGGPSSGGERTASSGRSGGTAAAQSGGSGSGSQTGGGTQTSGAQRMPGAGTGGQGQSRNATVVRVTPVVLGTIENSVVINGDVLARTQVSIYPTVAGKLTEARFQVGDTVRKGDVVAMVDPSKPGEVYSRSPVVSTISGTILDAPVNSGDTLTVQTPVYVIGDIASLLVETFVPERFSTAARKGLTAEVSLEALPGTLFNMVVDEISPVLDPASRTLKIHLRFTRQDPHIRAGMFATVSLVTNTRKDVPVIPRGAVINTYGSWIVFIVNERNIAARREIFLGLENEQFIEVISGLEVGDQVVTAGQNFLSDGDPVRVVP
ncbi:MAG: efflux RND transporter periplasmic adaptor subunit [Treponema sp.]|nr:efflux RND transporter periplasmic adaptor subunit [Treponema sp.]